VIRYDVDMKRLITLRRWKMHLKRRQEDELSRGSRHKARYQPAKRVRKTVHLEVPTTFSMTHNPEETLWFLQVLKVQGKEYNVSLDLTDVTLITADAIAVLTAFLSATWINTVQGNLPNDPVARQVLLQSGFFEHVKSETAIPPGQLGKIKERQSKIVQPTTAWNLIECGTAQAFGATKRSLSTRAAYTTLIELMNNTHNHAAGDDLESQTWWATSYGDPEKKRVCYTFVDMGVGIFRSVKMHPIQRTFRKLGFGGNAQLLREILLGLVESSTGLPYRGKGLPAIFRKSQAGNLKSLFIVANDVFANVSTGDYLTLKNKFRGTLLYWECEE
jgi:hypothetical protein